MLPADAGISIAATILPSTLAATSTRAAAAEKQRTERENDAKAAADAAVEKADAALKVDSSALNPGIQSHTCAKGIVSCRCGKTEEEPNGPRRLTSRTARNPDREFLKCGRCNFFRWIDEGSGPACKSGDKSALALRTSSIARNSGRQSYICKTAIASCRHGKTEEEPKAPRRMMNWTAR